MFFSLIIISWSWLEIATKAQENLNTSEASLSDDFYLSKIETMKYFYDYELPASRIAQEPLSDRAAARLLVLDRASQTIRHMNVGDLPDILAPNDHVMQN